MSNCNLFKVTITKLVVLSLLAFLSLALYARSTYHFSIDTILPPSNNNYSHSTVQATNPAQGIVRQIRHPSKYNTSQFDAKFVLEHPFLMDAVINSHNFKYVLRPKVNCSNGEIELVICVVISRDNHAGRSTIRRTWGSYAQNPENKAVLVFFVGSDSQESETGRRWVRRSRIEEEASTFGDILQENYIDSYNNLSLKSVSILKWVNTFCPNTKYILKVDDDMYVNIPFLMKILPEFIVESSPPSAFIIGCMQENAVPKRDPSSKWYTSYSMFREHTYPNYVSGPSYVMTREAALLLYEASLRVPRFWLEDVYITGMCSRKAKVRVYDSKYFSYSKRLASGCTFRTTVSGHRYTQEEIVKIHTELYNPHLQC